MVRREIVERAWRQLEPHLEEQGYELVELELDRRGSRLILRLFIDRPGGVTLNDCQVVSQLLSPLLDGLDLMEKSYVLEVSSPGFERPVRKAKDWERFVGERIKIKTLTPVTGRSHFSGVLTGFADGMVAVNCEGTPYAIHIENVSKAHLDR